MPCYTGINHLAMATGDMDATIRFWRDLLGMRMVVGLGRPGYRHYFFEISDTDMIAFFEWDGVEPLPEKDHGAPVRGPYVFDHVSICVASDDDLWELYDRFDAAGIWASEIVDHGFIHSVYAFDPNGIAIEFSSYTARADVRERPRMVDLHPTEYAREGPDPVPGHWPPVTDPTLEADKAVYPGEGEDVLDDERNIW